MTVRDVAQWIETIAPRHMTEEWDSVGLQVGDPNAPVETCLLTLDVTAKVVGEANRLGAKLIIAHHPVIFGGLSALTPQVPSGGAIMAAVRAGVSIYVAHTNLDASLEHGTCPALADRLGLGRGEAMLPANEASMGTIATITGSDEQVDSALQTGGLAGAPMIGWNVMGQGGSEQARGELRVTASEGRRLVDAAQQTGAQVTLVPAGGAPAAFGTGMICSVPSMSLEALAEYVARRLGVEGVQVVGNRDGQVGRVALVPGAGGSLIEIAAGSADALITGEIKYHDSLRAMELGTGVIAAGHHDTERPVLALLARGLTERFGEALHVATSQLRTEPIWTWQGA